MKNLMLICLMCNKSPNLIEWHLSNGKYACPWCEKVQPWAKVVIRDIDERVK